MSLSLIWVEILKIARRRGMLLSAVGLTCFAVLATFVTFWILHVRDEAEHPSAGGDGSFGIAVTFVSLLATVFAALIATVGCYQGFLVKGSAESVGRRTTVSVVQGIFLIILADAVFSIIFSWLGI